MSLDHAALHRALRSRDARFDGRFFTAVRTTRIYCRPICPARTPLPQNVRFFESAASAEAAGYRPCRRCRPEAAPGSPAWRGTETTAARAMRLIDGGALDAGSVDDLAARLGVGARHLRRLMIDHAGVAPLQLALTRRLHFARRLLHETTLPVGAVARSAGFGSERRFRDAFRRAFGGAPTALRRRGRAPEAPLEITLGFRPPMDAAALLRFLAPRAIPGSELAQGGTLSILARFGEDEGIVTARFDEAARCVRLGVPPDLAPHLLEIATRARRLLDLDSDPREIGDRLAAEPLLRPLVRKRPGLRSPGAWDPFATAVRVILGQQVSVAAATTLCGRLVAAHGEPARAGSMGLDRHFPAPAALARAPLERLGLPSRRAETLRRFAEAVDRDGMERVRLDAIPGLGPWTASVIAMRALSDPDAFPAGDLLVARVLGGERAASGRAESWRPFRAYAAMHLWTEASS